jgi:hypothetical protein
MVRIYCKTANAAAQLKRMIIRDVANGSLETWAYTTSKAKHDIIYHNPPQYVNDSDKNVIFRVMIDDTKVIMQATKWENTATLTNEMEALHTGRLVEALLKLKYINRFTVER